MQAFLLAWFQINLNLNRNQTLLRFWFYWIFNFLNWFCNWLNCICLVFYWINRPRESYVSRRNLSLLNYSKFCVFDLIWILCQDLYWLGIIYHSFILWFYLHWLCNIRYILRSDSFWSFFFDLNLFLNCCIFCTLCNLNNLIFFCFIFGLIFVNRYFFNYNWGSRGTISL